MNKTRAILLVFICLSLIGCSSLPRRNAWLIKGGDVAVEKIDSPPNPKILEDLFITWMPNPDMKIKTSKLVPNGYSAYAINDSDKLASYTSTDKMINVLRRRLPPTLERSINERGVKNLIHSKYILYIRPIRAYRDANNDFSTTSIILHIRLVDREVQKDIWRIAMTTGGSSEIELDKIVADSAQLIVDRLSADGWIKNLESTKPLALKE